MLGGSSIRLATIFGIRVGVNVSWFLILFLAIFWLREPFADELGDEQQGFIVAVLAAFGFFGSILLHELGHALAARREGIEVTGIDLFFFGGVMKMSRDTYTPGQEFRVAAAGPLVTLLIVVVGALAAMALLGADGFWDAARLDRTDAPGPFELWLSFLVSANVLLLVFNLVPAFPLDGGRIARAAAWKITGDRGKATRISAYLGQGFAALLIGYGLYVLFADDDTFGGLWAIVLGYLLGSSARAAIAQSAFTERLEGVTVADIMDAEPGDHPGRPAGRAGVGGVLPALPGLAVVRGRRGRRPLRRPRPPRRRRARRPPGGRRRAGARHRRRPRRPRARRRAARGAARLRAAAPPRRADGGRRRRPPARRGHARAGHARAAGARSRRPRRLAPSSNATRGISSKVVLGEADGDAGALAALADLGVDDRAAEQDRQARAALQHQRRGLEPAHVRHPRVEHDHVRLDPVERLQRRLRPVGPGARRRPRRSCGSRAPAPRRGRRRPSPRPGLPSAPAHRP